MTRSSAVAIYLQIVNRIPKALLSETVSKYNTDYPSQGSQTRECLLHIALSSVVRIRFHEGYDSGHVIV